MKLTIRSHHIGYLHLSQIDLSGTLIIGRLAMRWGEHARQLGRFTWYRLG